MSHLLRLSLTVLVVAPIACTRSDQASESTAVDGVERDDSGLAAGGEAGESDGQPTPIALTDARLDAYLAYRKEYNRAYAAWMKGAVDLGKSVDSSSTDIGKTYTAVTGAARLGEAYEKSLGALRAKHGFTANEDDRLWSAISEVVAARPLENPGAAAGFQSLRDMQAKGGDEGKLADELFASMANDEKAALTAARASYGDVCVEVLSRRVKDLAQFQIDTVNALVHSGAEAK